eukprot:6863482-Prymnesium_polylepis.1
MLPPRFEALQRVVHLHQACHERQLERRIAQGILTQRFANMLRKELLEVATFEQLSECRVRLPGAHALHCLNKLDARSSADLTQTPIPEAGDVATRTEARERRQPIPVLVDGQQQGLHVGMDQSTVDDTRQSWCIRSAVARDSPPQ